MLSLSLSPTFIYSHQRFRSPLYFCLSWIFFCSYFVNHVLHFFFQFISLIRKSSCVILLYIPPPITVSSSVWRKPPPHWVCALCVKRWHEIMFTLGIRMRLHGFASHLEFNKANGTSPTSMIEFIKIIIMLFLIDLRSAFLQRLSKKALNRLSVYFSPAVFIYFIALGGTCHVHFLYWWPCT